MTGSLLSVSLVVAQLMLALAMTFASIRLLRGPGAQDRVLALDALYIDAMLLMIVHGMRQATTLYIEIALVIAMLGFVSTAALARFLLRGEVIE